MDRSKLIAHIEMWKQKLGSASKVAQKCGINGGALSSILSGTYGADETHMLGTIAEALGYKETSWNIVPSINNYRRIVAAFNDAREESMWFAISNKAGSGKTGTLQDIYQNDTSGAVVYLQAEEWSARQFIIELVKSTIGISELKGSYKSIPKLIALVAQYFNHLTFSQPVLLIDEADKLRPAALRTLISLFNKTEDRLGLVMSGTENLEKEIENGVKLRKKGYDEISSRIGRTYIHLKGATENEVAAICGANNITETFIQKRIWDELEKVKKPTRVRTKNGGEREVYIEYLEDFRRLKRVIKRELLKLKAVA